MHDVQMAYRIEDGSTFVMIQRWVHIIRSDSIDAERLHESGVTQAESSIAQRVAAHTKSFGPSRLIAVTISASSGR